MYFGVIISREIAIRRQLLFRDSSHMLSANSLGVYYSPRKQQHLSFRNSSHMLFADKLRVYYLPKRKYGQPKLCKTCYKEKYTHSFKNKTSGTFINSTLSPLSSKFSQKVGKTAYPLQKIGIVYFFQIRIGPVVCNLVIGLFCLRPRCYST